MYVCLSVSVLACNAEIKEENPDATFGELGKIIGAKWHELTEEDKAPYQEKADEDKKRYAKAIAEWKAKHDGDDDE